MALKDTIKDLLNDALKNRNKKEISSLRLILAAIKDREISNREKNGEQALEDSEILDILSKMRQQRVESLRMYEQAGRVDLATTEQDELNVIARFMPEQFNAEQTQQVCCELINELNITSLKDMGRIMGKLKSSYGYRIDYGRAGSIVKELLQNKV